MQGKVSFIVINLFSNAILLARSLLFLKYLPDRDLGLIMIFQSIVAILGLTQIGLFNGGFRIMSIDSEIPNHRAVNNNNITFVAIITIFFISLSVLAYFINENDFIIYLIAAIAGGFSLLRNWFSNLLIARQRLRVINLLNLSGAIVAASFGLTIFKWGVTGALLSIVSEYLIFVSLFFITQKEYRLTKLVLSSSSIKKMLAFGFIPYLGGIAVILNNQIDRFFISEILSLEALGKFYLATAFISVFDLIPNNLNTLFSAPAMNNYAEKRLHDTIKVTKDFFLILIGYCLISCILLLLFGDDVIRLVFPQKSHQLKYVFIMLPGIVAITLSKPFSFILYVALDLKVILWSNIFSLFVYLSILIALVVFSVFNIENVAYGKSLQGVLFFIFLFTATMIHKAKISSFYYINRK